MRKLLLLLPSLFLVCGGSAGAQAARPAPVAGPLIVQQPPSHPGNPVHTPAGAGASHGSLPGAQKAALPPSPNKRLLPPTKEAGLWAADGAPVASAGLGVTVLGVGFDLGLELKPARAAHECAKAVNDAADSTTHWSKHTSRFPEEATRCIAARALLSCAVEVHKELLSKKRTFADFWTEHAASAAEAARRWEAKYCTGVVLDHTQEDYLSWLRSRADAIRPRQ